MPPRDFGEFQQRLRSSELVIPNIRTTQQLRVECSHFISCIQDDTTPRSDGLTCLGVVRVLTATGKGLRAGDPPVELLVPVA